MPRPRREFSLAERAWRRTLRLIRRGTSSLRVLPDFLIVGAQKSGTSSLHAYLEEHSQLVAPPDRKELRLFTRGLYVEQLLALFELWPRDEILVLDFDDLKRDPKGTTARVLERLGLSPLERDAWPIHNASSGDALPQDLRARLASYYKEPNEALADLLGWAPGWMKSE